MLQISHICKQYVTGDLVQTALDDISLSFRDNEFVAILGPSGSGKTTLLNIIGGLDRYDSGDLIINGISTKQYKDKDWDSYRNHTIGFVFQSYNLIPHQTVLANVELALTISGVSKSERRRRAADALERVGLGDQLHKRPNQMSGGQMQRVAIARALVNDPAILLADEPTGALDSDTSVQVMDMLAEVAKDRLVIMVTHNPELAEEYANRIVRVKDGHILEDTNPPEAVKDTALARHQNMGRSSMSTLTALGLSFNNLRTKKGRTLLTAFAGSIGIIGIALILALSTGVNTYIENLQKDTMTAYPISIESQSVDMSSLIEMGQKHRSKAKSDPDHVFDAVYADSSTFEAASTVTTSFKTNNLTEFKKYLDDPGSEIHQYIGENGIVYSYGTRFGVYTRDPEDALINTDGSSLKTDNQYSFMNMMMRSLSVMNGSGLIFQELMPGTNGALVSRTITENYDLVYGSIPNAYNELVLVLDKNNEIELTFLYQLGFLPLSEYRDITKRIEDGEEITEEMYRLDYADICNQEFRLIPDCDRYQKNDDGNYSLIDESSPEFDKLLDDALTLRITGIIRPKENLDNSFISQPVGYTSALTDYLITYTERSEVVKAQEADPDVNVLNGLHFDAVKKEDKLRDVQSYVDGLGISEKATLYQTILMLEQMSGKPSETTEPTESTESGASTEATTVTEQGTLAPAANMPTEVVQSAPQKMRAGTMDLGNFLGERLLTLEAETQAAVGISIADFRLIQAPTKTMYEIGEPLDLAGGTVHDSYYVTNEAGERVLVDTVQPLDYAGYTLEAEPFDNTRAGIYPVSVVKNYTDADGNPAQARAVFYVMVTAAQVTTDPTEPATPPTEAPTDPTDPPSMTDPAEPTEATPRYTLPDFTLPEGFTLPDFTLPQDYTGFTLPEGVTGFTLPEGYTLPQDYTLPEGYTWLPEDFTLVPEDVTMPTMPDFSDFFSDVLADALYKYMQKQTANGTASPGVSQMDMASIFASMMGGGTGMTQEQLAGLMGGGTATGGMTPEQMASLYAQMMGGTGAAAGGLPQQDLASMYAQMMGGQGTTMPADMAGLAAQMAGQSGLTQEQMAEMYNQIYGNITAEDIQKMMEIAEMSEPQLAEALDEYMKDPDEDILLQVYERFIASGSYDGNMSTFGVVSKDAPESINIYVDSFEAKERISDCIKHYNETASEENQISYTDYIGLLMSSVTTIVDVISYILIAFVAVSLIVSSIMIGIITYISVLERTKEIGILRAIGASKRNISQVFNAETFIIGLCSGLLGVGLSWLILIPGNILIHHLAESNSVSAILPIPSAAVLVLISIVLTLIGGFIPAKKASTKDPVTALRTE